MDTAGVSVQKFKVAESAAEAEAIAKELSKLHILMICYIGIISRAQN